MDDWIKLHRKFLEWEWFDNPIMVKLFLYMILKANHDTEKWHGVNIPRGSFLTGLLQLQKETKITVQTLRTCLGKLEKTGEINMQTNNQYRIINICNYDSYQEYEKTANKRTNKRLTSNQQATNNKQEVIDKSITNNGTEIIKNWKNDFETYKEKCSKSFELIETNEDLKKRVLELYPNIDYVRSVKKAYYYWITEKGWDKKRKSGSETIDWKSTILKTIQFNIINL